MKITLKIILGIIVLTSVLFAQKASIRGTVTDAKTGEPLPGANILVKGTYYGAASDEDGTFIIPGISPGSYDLEISMMGYTMQLYSGIDVKAGETRILDVKLEPTILALGQEITVMGERPIIDADATSSSVSVSASDLENSIVESVADIVARQTGVTKSGDNEIHIRGGRVDEGQFIVDGLSIKDPLTGATNSLYVNPNAIEELEFITGGFNAEYGQAMSGIIDVKLKEGAIDLEGSVRYKTDKLLPDHFNTDNIEFTLGGPFFRNLNVIPGKLSFFFSGYLYITDTYLPNAGPLFPYRDWTNLFVSREENNFSSMAKISWLLTPKHKFAISYNHSANVDRRYNYTYKEIMDNYPTTTRESQVVNIIWTHTLSSELFYTTNLGYFYTGRHEAVQNKHWTEYNEMLDLDPTTYTPLDPFGTLRVSSGNEFWDHGDAPNWYDYFSKNYSIETDITWQPNSRHTVKGGFNHRNTYMQVIDIYKPWTGISGFGETYDYYDVSPSDGAIYIQDKITFEGMIANIGLRYDYWIIGEYVENVVHDPDILTITPEGKSRFMAETFNLLGRRTKGHLSPRLGISHPVTDNDVLYFNYGHFSQLPTYNYVYANLTSRSENPYSLIGNPNLNPKTTVAYELGIKHKFSKSTAIEFKAYYKDMFDYETSQRVTSFNPLIGNYSMLIYINADYARSRGIEITFRRLYGRYFSGDASFSYSISTGKSSRPDDNLLIEAGMLSQKPLSENYLSWDEPFRLRGNLRFNMSEDTPPRLFGLRIPNNWKLNIHFDARSGQRYTKSVATDTVQADDGTWFFLGTSMSDNPYGAISDPFVTIDVKFTKDFFYKSLRYGLYIDAQNILNYKMPRRINPYTGQPYDPGEIIPFSYYGGRNPNYDPARYYAPRQVTVGLFMVF
jgi:outer membrane receptor protein involved in Fe transport